MTLCIDSRTKDERLWLVSARSDTELGETFLYNRDTKKLMLQYRVRDKLTRGDLAPAVRYNSSDGLEIPAYLTLPQGNRQIHGRNRSSCRNNPCRAGSRY